MIGVGLSAAYLVAAYLLRPSPDYSNIGFLGGLIDHPFRYSDDINRFLMFLLAFLWPGRFVATAIMDIAKRLGLPDEQGSGRFDA